MLSVKELVGEISGKSGKSGEEVKKLIKDKQLELSGLVSEEGAAYIVGRELGVELMQDTQRQLKVKNIVPDMRSVSLVAKVVNVFEPREFESKGKKGTVASIILGDETGTIRLPLWNEETELLSSLGISEDDAVEVSGAWAKPDRRSDGVELRLGRRGKLRKLDDAPDIDVKAGAMPEKDAGFGKGREPAAPAQRMSISALQPGTFAQVKGCIVQVYRRKPYYEACPTCGSRPEEKDGKFVCKEHGEIKPAYNLLFSGVIDDGTGNLRFVLFREQAEKLLGAGPEEVKKRFDELGQDAFWENPAILGKEYVMEGRIKTNDFSKEPEMLANAVSDVDVKAEVGRLLKEVEK